MRVLWAVVQSGWLQGTGELENISYCTAVKRAMCACICLKIVCGAN